MPKYRKKPVVIEAIEWTGENTTKILHWMFPDLPPDAEASELTIKTLEGEMKADKGDYIIKGVAGEFSPCKPDIFKATYDAV
jgi:hypothetical protein